MAVNQRRRFIDEAEHAEPDENSLSDSQSSFNFTDDTPRSADNDEESSSFRDAENGESDAEHSAGAKEKRVVVRPKAKRTVRTKTPSRTSALKQEHIPADGFLSQGRSDDSRAAYADRNDGFQNNSQTDAENDLQNRDSKPRLSIRSLSSLY